MSLTDMQSRKAVLQAVAEYDSLGAKAFLEKYGYGEATRYFLEVDGKLYDSKAIVGAAHGYEFPELGPLTSREFSGGASTVQHKLEQLGFTVVVKG